MLRRRLCSNPVFRPSGDLSRIDNHQKGEVVYLRGISLQRLLQVAMKSGFKACALFILIFILAVYSVAAQDAATPTPAPSKTPTPTPVATIPPIEITEPWTQSDLSILTGNVQRPNGIVWHNDMLYTACNGDFTLYEINSRTAATRTYIWGVRNAHTLYAEDLETGELNIWVPDYQSNALVRVDRLGVETIIPEMQGPWGIAYLDEAHFLITELIGNQVLVVNRQGESVPVAAEFRSPTGIAIDGDRIYVANTGSARRAIEWIAKDALPEIGAEDSDEAVEVLPLVSGLQNTTGIVLGPDGYLYFAYSLGTRGVVGRVNPDVCIENGGCSNDQVEIVVFTELAAPLAGLTISPDMRLFVHTMFSPDIYWVALAGSAEVN